MRRILSLLLMAFILVACKTHNSNTEPDITPQNIPAYIKVNNLSDYKPYLLLGKDAISMPVRKGMSTVEVLPEFCNRSDRFSVMYDFGEKLEYVVQQEIVFENGVTYSLTIENYTCSLNKL